MRRLTARAGRRHRHLRLLRAGSSRVPTRRARRRSRDPNGARPALRRQARRERLTGWAFMAFRGAGDRDFVGELTDPLPLQIDDDGRSESRCRRRQPAAPRSAMTLAAEVQELLAWDKASAARCTGLSVDEQRAVIHDALEQRAAETGLVVEPVARVEDLAVPVGGDVDSSSRLHTLRRRPAPGVPPHPRRWIRPRLDRLALQRCEVRTHLRRRRVRRRHHRVPSRARVPVPDRTRGLLLGAVLARRARRRRRDRSDAGRGRRRVGRRQPRRCARAHGA